MADALVLGRGVDAGLARVPLAPELLHQLAHRRLDRLLDRRHDLPLGAALGRAGAADHILQPALQDRHIFAQKLLVHRDVAHLVGQHLAMDAAALRQLAGDIDGPLVVAEGDGQGLGRAAVAALPQRRRHDAGLPLLIVLNGRQPQRVGIGGPPRDGPPPRLLGQLADRLAVIGAQRGDLQIEDHAGRREVRTGGDPALGNHGLGRRGLRCRGLGNAEPSPTQAQERQKAGAQTRSKRAEVHSAYVGAAPADGKGRDAGPQRLPG
ncbi:protein of unknown function [Azospirillum baldaniorum]|uniref:Uncharacterized protein n=1 Tax=Azospirillum baldaniorum TaxID=1064539 RepID=A0A9P1NMG6_9PROT|nr:protein of unknown function [Azospirillum baldaniorum]